MVIKTPVYLHSSKESNRETFEELVGKHNLEELELLFPDIYYLFYEIKIDIELNLKTKQIFVTGVSFGRRTDYLETRIEVK